MITKKDEYIKKISGSVLRTNFLFFAISLSLIFAGVYYAGDIFFKEISKLDITKINSSDLQGIITKSLSLKDCFYLYIWPLLGGSVFLLTLISWLIIRISIKKNIEKIPSRVAPAAETTKKEDPELEKRKFLHLLTVLQEEGRFLDFLNEDLGDFEDDEIGAAVRSVHKGCKESLVKYMDLKPLLDEEEETLKDVEKGFDPEKLKLTGNVVGEPPFKGYVRHRGWMADNVKLPVLKKVKNASYIVPAEIEVE